jgi:protein-tyrosine phosphatase
MEREVGLEGTCNTRTLGGLPTVNGFRLKNVLWRSDELSNLTSNDWQLLHTLGVRTICDLRRRDEAELYPTRVPDEFDILVLWWAFDDAAIQAMQGLTNQIRLMLAPLAEMNEEDMNAWVQNQYKKYYQV